MNLRRGLFRLWFAISVIWIGAAATMAYRDTSIPSITKSCSELLEFTADSTGQKLGPADVTRCEQTWQRERLEMGGLALGPPTGLLIFGLMVAWIASGFRRANN